MRSSFRLRLRLPLGLAFACACASTTAVLGCPNSRPNSRANSRNDGSIGAEGARTASAATATIATPPPTAPLTRTDPALSGEEGAIAPALSPGVPLPTDATSSDGETWGVELLMEVRPRFEVAAPEHLGTTAAAQTEARKQAKVATLRVLLAEGRMRIKFGAHTFTLADGTELRADAAHGGSILFAPGVAGYRIVPPGALRPLLNERRVDVIPLAPTRLSMIETSSRLGHGSERVSITTAYGVMHLEQIAAPVPPRGMVLPSRDAAGVSKGEVAAEGKSPGLDGAGESLCRTLLELVAADRALGGKPCDVDRIPVVVEIAFATGGGLIIETTSVREGAIARADLAFPPLDAKLAAPPFPVDDGRALLEPEALLSLRPKGESAILDLQNRSSQPRVAFLDGVPVAWLAPAHDRALSLRAGRYVIEWRTPIGEVADAPREVVAPGHASTGQPSPSPSPPASTSPIASARIGP